MWKAIVLTVPLVLCGCNDSVDEAKVLSEMADKLAASEKTASTAGSKSAAAPKPTTQTIDKWKLQIVAPGKVRFTSAPISAIIDEEGECGIKIKPDGKSIKDSLAEELLRYKASKQGSSKARNLKKTALKETYTLEYEADIFNEGSPKPYFVVAKKIRGTVYTCIPHWGKDRKCQRRSCDSLKGL